MAIGKELTAMDEQDSAIDPRSAWRPVAGGRCSGYAVIAWAVALALIGGASCRRGQAKSTAKDVDDFRASRRQVLEAATPPPFGEVLALSDAQATIATDGDRSAAELPLQGVSPRPSNRRDRPIAEPRGDAAMAAAARTTARRWQLRLPGTTSLSSYSALLDSLEIELAIEAEAGEFAFLSHLSRRRPSLRRGAPSAEHHELLVGDATLRGLAEKLAARAGVAVEEKQIRHYCPPRLVESIDRLVRDAPAALHTVVLVPAWTGGKYQLQVVESP